MCSTSRTLFTGTVAPTLPPDTRLVNARASLASLRTARTSSIYPPPQTRKQASLGSPHLLPASLSGSAASRDVGRAPVISKSKTPLAQPCPGAVIIQPRPRCSLYALPPLPKLPPLPPVPRIPSHYTNLSSEVQATGDQQEPNHELAQAKELLRRQSLARRLAGSANPPGGRRVEMLRSSSCYSLAPSAASTGTSGRGTSCGSIGTGILKTDSYNSLFSNPCSSPAGRDIGRGRGILKSNSNNSLISNSSNSSGSSSYSSYSTASSGTMSTSSTSSSARTMRPSPLRVGASISIDTTAAVAHRLPTSQKGGHGDFSNDTRNTHQEKEGPQPTKQVVVNHPESNEAEFQALFDAAIGGA